MALFPLKRSQFAWTSTWRQEHFCVCQKNDYFCEQETQADTCTLTTARNKLDVKRKKSPQGKDHRVKGIGVKDQGSVLLASEPEDKVLSSLLLKVWVALAGLALSFHSCSAFSLPVWHLWANAVSHCVAPGTKQPRFWIVSHVGATMVIFSWQKSCDKERWRSKFVCLFVCFKAWGCPVPTEFPGVRGYFFAPSSHFWRGLSNWQWLHTGATYKSDAKLTSFGVLLKLEIILGKENPPQIPHFKVEKPRVSHLDEGRNFLTLCYHLQPHDTSCWSSQS